MSLAALAIMGGCAAALAACETRGIGKPSYSQAVFDDLGAVRADEAALFAGLLQAPPACASAATAELFTKASTDLLKAQTDAAAAPDGATARGVANLQKTLADIQAAAAGGSSCLPADIVSSQQKLFEDGLNGLINAETAKKT